MKRIFKTHTPRGLVLRAPIVRRMFGGTIPADLPLERDGSAHLEAVMPHIERAHVAAMRAAIDQDFIVTAGTLDALRDW
ncbi:Hypothethical protein (modular protein) [Cupriavidus taiwanensis]|nr:Hypothethical protein (modular protein) [Cupriavidus taiwanensis]SOZ25876.1 Hypothethical protein (modular protein) [Cupriavidus taiwanensis]SOZ45065.1 Hypothethical protein (modular protein) [Cupriavidus taiwanensis]